MEVSKKVTVSAAVPEMLSAPAQTL